jgi:hypothetical protein
MIETPQQYTARISGLDLNPHIRVPPATFLATGGVRVLDIGAALAGRR